MIPSYRDPERDTGQAQFLSMLERTMNSDELIKLYTEKGQLTTGLLTLARRLEDPVPEWAEQVCEDQKIIYAMIKVWERLVWFGGSYPSRKNTHLSPGICGVQVYNRDASLSRLPSMPENSMQRVVYMTTGMTAHVGKAWYATSCMAGAAGFFIEGPRASISISLDEGSANPNAGIDTVYGTLADIYALVYQSIQDWNSGKLKAAFGKERE